jgi:signal transduction histidine kinase
MLRIAQEAITNARRHSRGRLIRVRCGHEPGVIRVTVTDDGIGLPPDDSAHAGIGRAVMAYRAKAIGASLSLASAPAGGVAVTCELRCRGTGTCADPAHGG